MLVPEAVLIENGVRIPRETSVAAGVNGVSVAETGWTIRMHNSDGQYVGLLHNK